MVKIREVTRKEEFERCVELQRNEWGWADLDIVPVRSFVVVSDVGGLTLGAFDGSQLIGFINTLPGIRKATPYWYSRMLGIDRNHWGVGVGTALKEAQREHALRRGIGLIEWTFDPLESKSAYINLEKLGVVIRRYCVDHYGYTTSHLQRGMASDRLMAEWWLKRPRMAGASDKRHVSIPTSIQQIKDRNLDEAIRVQNRVREEFQEHISDGYMVVGFERRSNENKYVLSPKAGTEYEN